MVPGGVGAGGGGREDYGLNPGPVKAGRAGEEELGRKRGGREIMNKEG